MNKNVRFILTILLKLLKYCFTFLFLAMTLLILFILKEAYEQEYEPRGYVSPYNKDVSSCFQQIPADDFVATIQSIMIRAKAIENVKGISFITVYFNSDNKIKSFEAVFILKNKGLFRGFMKVADNGITMQEYWYYKYAGEKKKIADYENILVQCKLLEKEVRKSQYSIQKAMITDKKIYFYNNDDLISEYSYE